MVTVSDDCDLLGFLQMREAELGKTNVWLHNRCQYAVVSVETQILDLLLSTRCYLLFVGVPLIALLEYVFVYFVFVWKFSVFTGFLKKN